jgi:hypothetical protein
MVLSCLRVLFVRSSLVRSPRLHYFFSTVFELSSICIQHGRPLDITEHAALEAWDLAGQTVTESIPIHVAQRFSFVILLILTYRFYVPVELFLCLVSLSQSLQQLGHWLLSEGWPSSPISPAFALLCSCYLLSVTYGSSYPPSSWSVQLWASRRLCLATLPSTPFGWSGSLFLRSAVPLM